MHPLCISFREFMNPFEMIGKIVCVHMGIWVSVLGFYQIFSDLNSARPRDKEPLFSGFAVHFVS